jgi:hypothetical protein
VCGDLNLIYIVHVIIMFHAIFDIFSIQSVLIFIDSIDSGIFICKIINLLVKKVMDVKTQIKLKKQSFYCPSEFHSHSIRIS